MVISINLPSIKAFKRHLLLFCFSTSVECRTGYYLSQDRCIGEYDQTLIQSDQWSNFYRLINREQKQKDQITHIAHSSLMVL